MAARKPRSKANAAATPSLFALAERQIVGLYDAGVLSPAVLQHVIAAYGGSSIDWSEAGTLHTVDDHTVQEAVVLIMMPGRALRSAQKDFVSVMEHLAGAAQTPAQNDSNADEEPSDDEALLDQLGGKRTSTRRAKADADDEATAEKRRSFNPLVGARPMPTHK
ncbi:hypothetical protein P9239_05855 [Caballeronia sp. LZ062]|uniref:hypothetical protein n=1 Tax=unclassified Caballeronia TaxID=2646786 RepID=UPI002859DC8A|nr:MULTISPECIES: hypothetical protein [unclassified Caballeronia]MDR5856718.1 hypothetical protein [Caballeronia sp. LZ050]MDR5869885.1 hypothetical protein [Caballeronia sp. LZ062]